MILTIGEVSTTILKVISATNTKVIFATEDVIRTTLKVISATTKVILTTEEVITAILKVISATTKVILTTEEVITAILKVISATTKVILTTEEVITAILKVFLNWIIWKIAFYDIFTISKIALRGRMLVQNYIIFHFSISTDISPDQ